MPEKKREGCVLGALTVLGTVYLIPLALAIVAILVIVVIIFIRSR
jgi:hypothetical protein